MPSVARDRIAETADYGVVEDRHEDVEGITIQFVTFREDVDAAPLLRGLPDDRCTCPHWGYVFKGKVAFDVGDRVEVYEAGDAFYLSHGHIPRAEPGTEYLQFSPADELHAVSAHMQKNMAAMQGA
jgi:hypothetical protein